MTQVYAVVYNKKGNFLIAEKPIKGYYFNREIVKEGQKLNGGGKIAFPGGKIERGTAVNAAIREFTEETTVKLSRWDVHQHKFDEYYYAVYLPKDESDFDNILEEATKGVKNAMDIAKKIKEREITTSNAIKRWAKHNHREPWPADNELDKIKKMNVVKDWKMIETWKNDRAINWFYHILLYLKKDILEIRD